MMGRDKDIKQASLYEPNYPSSWPVMPLYEMATWVNGLAFRKIQFHDTGLPVIKIAEIKNGITSQTKFTNDSFDKNVYIESGDLLFSWSGQPETSIDAWRWSGPTGWLNQHIFKVSPNDDFDETFFFFLLKYLKPNFINIARNKQTTGLGHVTKKDLSLMKGALPPLPIQKRIAHVLGTLDDKIELNRKMNQTLEAMAQAIFKSWFVDFDPVHAKAEGRATGLPPEIDALFPDSFVESELGLIPEGWEVKALDDVSNYLNGLAWKKYEVEEDEPSLPVIKIREMRQGITNACDRAKLTVPPEYIIQKGDILFSWSGTLLVTLWADAPGILNQHLFKVSSDTYPPWFSYYSTQNYLHRFQRIAADKATTMGHIRRKDLSEAYIPIPPQPVFNYISSIIEPVYDRIIETLLENSTLTQLRDTLLPKLLSGEISVEDVEMEGVEMEDVEMEGVG